MWTVKWQGASGNWWYAPPNADRTASHQKRAKRYESKAEAYAAAMAFADHEGYVHVKTKIVRLVPRKKGGAR